MAPCARPVGMALAAGVLLWHSVAHAACTLGAVSVLPVSRAHGGEQATVTINGKPAQLIIDTGAFATTLKRSSAERLGLRMSILGADAYGVGGTRAIYRGTASRMDVGGLTADGMVLGGLDMLDKPSEQQVDGLFGMNMMAAYDIDLDFVGDHVVLYEAEGDCRKPTVALAQPLYIVKLEYIEHDRQADIDVLVDGHHVRAVLDSGATHTTLFRSGALRLGVDTSALHRPGGPRGYGVGPLAVPVMEHVFDSVRIGDLQINNMKLDIIDQADLGAAIVHTGSRLADPSLGETGGEEMLLGADFMRKVHVWISHSSHTLIMQYPPQPSVLPH